VPCCFDNDVSGLVPFYQRGSQVRLNYMAAYQFDSSSQLWHRANDPSFNVDGSQPPFDLMQPYGWLQPDQAWLAPQPGGSAFWSLGYYPAGVRGVGPPGMMFVLSAEEFWGATWYMLNTVRLGKRRERSSVEPTNAEPSAPFPSPTHTHTLTRTHKHARAHALPLRLSCRCPPPGQKKNLAAWQLTLDRGPQVGYPEQSCKVTNDNCWAAGNAGEMDFLEPPWNSNNASATQGYRTSYSTQFNQVGRCFNGGVNGGGFSSRNYLLTASAEAPEAVVYVAVVDSVGNWVYRIPATQVESVWPGLGRKQANATLPRAPTRTPAAMNPCLGGYCAVFTSNCQATTWAEADQQSCGFNRQQGFCGNWMAQLADTHQLLFPSSDCQRDIRGGQTMPWCTAMVPPS
jgi:hypothetical protein